MKCQCSDCKLNRKDKSPLIRNLRQLLRLGERYQRGINREKILGEIEEKIGIKAVTIRSWFMGARTPLFVNVHKIAKLKKTNPYDLYVDKDRWINVEHLSAENLRKVKEIIGIIKEFPCQEKE